MSSHFLFLLGTFFIVNLSIAFIPYWTRKTENFGVSIPESMYYRKEFKAMRTKYATIMIITTIVMFLIFIFLAIQIKESIVITIFIIALLAYYFLSFLLYLPFHSKMKKIKATEKWQQARRQTIVVDTKFREEKFTFSNSLFLIPAFIIIATIIFTFMIYDRIPERVPIHTDFLGNVTYKEKSPGILLLLPITQIFMLGLFITINFVIKNSKQQVSAENPEISKQQNIMFRRRWSLYTIISSIIMTIMFSFLQLTFIYPTLLPYIDPVLYSCIAIILLGTIFLAMNTGQGGSRIKINKNSDEGVIDRDDDRYWKLGQFYFNKNDPSIFIEKRFGVGWTNNWAHPVSWIFIIAILLLALAIPIFL